MSLTRYCFVLGYDGTAYAGWQVQPSHATVQGAFEHALQALEGAPVKAHGSGRTDQGVHALGQVAHADLARFWRAPDLLRALNSELPPDIRVFRIKRVKHDFHARRDAAAKEYRYCIWDGPVMPPELRLYRTFSQRPLNVDAMRRAASLLVGKHDFAAFAANPNRELADTTRTLSLLDVRKRGHDIAIRARADGFLYRMVRSLAGFLIRVGEGALQPEIGPALLAARKRTAVAPTAPPQGLFLWRVWY